jgi:hypothetical protein
LRPSTRIGETIRLARSARSSARNSFPLGHHHQRIGIVGQLPRPIRSSECAAPGAVRGRPACHRVIGFHPRAHLQQAFGDVQRGRVAQVVGIRLEGQAQQSDGPALQDEQLFLQFLNHRIPLRGVHLERSLQQRAW